MTTRLRVLIGFLVCLLGALYFKEPIQSFVTNRLIASHPSSDFEIPPLRGNHWINSKPLSSEDLKGKIVLVDFWEYTCVNCLRTLPYVKSWHERYKDQGLLIIGVHTPEFEFGKKVENVEKAVAELGIKYPVVMDNEYSIWSAFNNEYWPREYLFDSTGRLRYDHVGEGNYAKTDSVSPF